MKVSFIIYLVEDTFGQKSYAVCEEGCDIIQIYGLQNSEKEELYFESDAYHLEDFCKVNGLKYKRINKDYDFNQLW